MQEWSTEKEESTETTKTITTTAWYTPEIPVSVGPDGYWGLPGLILEVQEDRRVLLCSQIILNPSEKFSIEVPSRGKVVTQDEFNTIQEEKNKEWIERNTGGSKNGYQIISVKTTSGN